MSFDVRRAGGQEARRAAEMVLAILGERVDHGEGAGKGSVRWSLARRAPPVASPATPCPGLADGQQLAQLTDASLCHGWAGLIQTVSRAAADALNDELASHLRRLNVRLNKHLDHHGLPDGAGLMDGTAGIHLVRLTDPVNTAITAPWDRCLLLTG
jgi:hypothetical protein